MIAATVCLALGLVGPLQTSVQPDSTGLVYWTAVIVPTFLLVLLNSLIARETARNLGWPWGLAALVAGFSAVGPIVVLTLVMDRLLMPMEHWHDARMLLLHVLGVELPIILTVNALMPTVQPLGPILRSGRQAPPGPRDEPPLPVTAQAITAQAPQPLVAPTVAARIEASPLFERLPPDLGQDVVCIRADNHFIEVSTILGSARVLMRLGDAEADLVTLPGMRVHRSWWVKLSHVLHIDRSGGGTLELVTTTGARISVARGQRDAVQAEIARR